MNEVLKFYVNRLAYSFTNHLRDTNVQAQVVLVQTMRSIPGDTTLALVTINI